MIGEAITGDKIKREGYGTLMEFNDDSFLKMMSHGLNLHVSEDRDLYYRNRGTILPSRLPSPPRGEIPEPPEGYWTVTGYSYISFCGTHTIYERK